MRRDVKISICTWLLGIAIAGSLHGQQPAAPVIRTAPHAENERDAQVEAAEAFIGRSLFLRCFCAENNLSFDAQGRLSASAKLTDWTLAGVNVAKAERKGANLVEIEGVRVAVRFMPERREFERHPQNDEKLRILIADSGDARQFQRALDAVFAQGIDPGLQRVMPDYWRHYFDPLLPWPADALAGQTIYIPGPNGQALNPAGTLPLPVDPKGVPVTGPVVTHRAEASAGNEALRDRVRGGVQVRVVVDVEGMIRRPQISRPLGYGLDERAVETLMKFRFAPAMRDGRPVASVLLVNEDFAADGPPK